MHYSSEPTAPPTEVMVLSTLTAEEYHDYEDVISTCKAESSAQDQLPDTTEFNVTPCPAYITTTTQDNAESAYDVVSSEGQGQRSDAAAHREPAYYYVVSSKGKGQRCDAEEPAYYNVVSSEGQGQRSDAAAHGEPAYDVVSSEGWLGQRSGALQDQEEEVLSGH